MTFIGTFGLFLTLFLALHPLPADDRHRGGQGRDARCRPAHGPRPQLRLRGRSRSRNPRTSWARARRIRRRPTAACVPARHLRPKARRSPRPPVSPRNPSANRRQQALVEPFSAHSYAASHRYRQASTASVPSCPDAAVAFPRGRADARRGLQTLGRVLAVPDPRHGRRDGPGQIGRQLHRAGLRADRHGHGAAARTRQRALPLSAHRAGQAGRTSRRSRRFSRSSSS